MDFVTTQCMADARSVAYKPKLIAVQLYISASQVNNPFLTLYTVFQKKTSTHIIGYKLRNSCPILIIFDIKIPHIIWHRKTA